MAGDRGLEELAADELAAVERTVRALVAHDVAWLEAIGAYDGQSDPYVWTRDYGRWDHVDLAVPPGQPASWEGSVIRSDPQAASEAGADPAYVVVDMWTAQEGRSDLSLELDLAAGPDGSVSTRFRGLHVM
jgi:hypothetical protein